jgi:hypothetical protein
VSPFPMGQNHAYGHSYLQGGQRYWAVCFLISMLAGMKQVNRVLVNFPYLPHFVFNFVFICFWDRVSLCSQAGFKLIILLPQPPESWDYRFVLSYPAPYL